jgi:hypothetical protein
MNNWYTCALSLNKVKKGYTEVFLLKRQHVQNVQKTPWAIKYVW